MSVFKYLDLSTAYVSQLEMRRIQEAPHFLAAYPEGAILWVGDKDSVEEEDWAGFENLARVMALAAEQDCFLVRLDADGDPDEEGLPRFEW